MPTAQRSAEQNQRRKTPTLHCGALAIYDDAADLLANFETSIFAQRR
jgi:hypothetical protein